MVVVGVWDPFLSSHRELLQGLRDRATQDARSSLAVIIDPAPGTLGYRRYGASGWPVYDSIMSRIRLMLGCGLDAVLLMRFRKRDYTATAAEFLEVVCSHVRIAELWIGARQQLGPGPRGWHPAIAEHANAHAMRLTILPEPPLPTYDVRSFLASGRLADAIAVVGRPPVWERPRSGELRLAWQPGTYRAVPLEHPDAVGTAPVITLSLAPRSGGPGHLNWPCRRIKYLAFVSGPRDQMTVR
jgi:FAD synthase